MIKLITNLPLPAKISALIGAGFSFVVLFAFATGAVSYVTEPPAKTAEHEFHKHPEKFDFSFNGPLGKFDTAQLQRGYKVFKEVCSACHSLKYVAFRDLKDLGYSEGQVKAIAAEWRVPGVDPATGEATTRPGEPKDHFPLVFPNNIAAAAANNNAIPPDLSLITKARHDGSNYVASLLSGYQPMPAELKKKFPDFALSPTGHYNPYFANLGLAMAPPLTGDGQVTYDDGTKSTVKQMATDVAAFLTWTAEPKLVKRRQTGLWFIGFMIFVTALAFMSYKSIWADLKRK